PDGWLVTEKGSSTDNQSSSSYVDEAVWASLLSACKRFGKTQMGIRVADSLMGLDVKDPSSFILLSNAYAGASMWEMLRNEVFHAGETSHSLKDEMSVLLKDLDEEMRRRGYVPDVSFVLRDIGEKDKEISFFGIVCDLQ
ncbi:hypothetical protein Tco_1179084, partial [Tanacetum coccineum]